MRVRGPITLAIALLLPIGIAWFKFGGDHVALSESIAEAIDQFPKTGDDIAADLQKGARFESVNVEEAATGSAASFLANTPDGLVATGAIVAGVRNQPFLINDVILDYANAKVGEVPAEITAIRPVMGCRLTAPETGTVVGHVTAGKSGLALPLSTYGDADLADGVQDFVDAYRAGAEAAWAGQQAHAYNVYDVAVTETGAPVYLVLESGSGNLIWNIHVAEGVRIERVVLLGADQAGVANLDPVVPVEVLLNDGLASCGIRPAYALNSAHRHMVAAASGEMTREESEAFLAELRAAVDAYDIWFRDSFGLRAGESRAGFDVGTMSMVGPLPETDEAKAVYARIEGARIRMTRDVYFEIAGQVPKGEDFAARVKAIATNFAFGNLSSLRQGVSF